MGPSDWLRDECNTQMGSVRISPGTLLELSAIVFPAVFKLAECVSGARGGSYTMWQTCIGLKSMNREEKS